MKFKDIHAKLGDTSILFNCSNILVIQVKLKKTENINYVIYYNKYLVAFIDIAKLLP